VSLFSKLSGLHQYVSRHSHAVVDESLLADRVIRFLYAREREDPSLLQRALASPKVTQWLAHWEFDRHLANPSRHIEQIAKRLSINTEEIVGGVATMRTMRDLFERKIRFWDVRPLPIKTCGIVSPADGKALPFLANDATALPIKEKFIGLNELLGHANPWVLGVHDIAGVIVRLTPDVYHYTHTPVTGRVVSHQLIEGAFHSCNPLAATRLRNSYPRNRRAVTVYDTDISNGSGVGIVVQVDVAAMMIGQIVGCYSERKYEQPAPLRIGQLVVRGMPVSLFRPGSSTSVVLWHGSRASVANDLVSNSTRVHLRSRFSDWLQSAWVETALRVRQPISEAIAGETS
jgi:phosphatidylserine decarboxylase